MMDLKSRLRRAAALFVELPTDSVHADSDAILSSVPSTLRSKAPLHPAPSLQPTGVSEEDRYSTGTPTGHIAQPVNQTLSGPSETAIRDIDTSIANFATSLSNSGDDSLDFAAIYVGMGLLHVAFTAEQTMEILHSLPADLTLDAKRTTVRATIETVGKSIEGATPDSILADASRKRAALTAFADICEKQTHDFVEAGEFEIQNLKLQIEEKRQGITAAKAHSDSVRRACHVEADRLGDVLGLLSLDIPQ